MGKMNQDGFSLIEVLVATALLVVLFAVTAGVTMFGFQVSERMQASNTALDLARIRLEEVIAQNFDDIASSPNGDFVETEVLGRGDEFEELVTVMPIGAAGLINPPLRRVSITMRTRTAPFVSETLTTTVGE